jgi:protein-L-isoaspartate(D-aspartate) O-methyltransferase
MLLVLFLALMTQSVIGQDEQQWMAARVRMVREEVIEAGITNRRVITSLSVTPRHLFVSAEQRKLAYFDAALPIGAGQTISSPFVVAYMTQALDPQPADNVLEIGTGSGYQAAVLSPLVANVYSIEIVEPLARKAAQTLRRLKYANVHTKCGDGFQGWAEHAPFDKVIVTCSPERIPQPLIEQLREGGRMVIPLGERYQQSLYLLKKVRGEMVSEELEPTFFVPMTGRAEELRQKIGEDGLPQLVNGGFEQTGEEGELPGWYYVRQAEIIADDQAPEGKHWLRLRNDSAGRGAQALQALGMDGRQVRAIEVSITMATDDVRPGLSPQQLPRVELSFFDERRAPIGSGVLGPWYGTSNWKTRRTRIKVPPKSRLSVLMVGLFGATGQLSVDQLTVSIVNRAPSR